MSVQWPKELYKMVYDYLPLSDQLQIAWGAIKINPEDKRYHEIFVFFQHIVNTQRHSINQFLSALEAHNASYIKKIFVEFASDEDAEPLSMEQAYARLEVKSPTFAQKWSDDYPINFYLRYQRIFQYYRDHSEIFKRAFAFPTLHCIGYGYLRVPVDSTLQSSQLTALIEKSKKGKPIIAETARILSDAGLVSTKLVRSKARKDGWEDVLPQKKQGSVMCVIM